MSESISAPLVWFVTGCSSGFGKRLAEEILARGDRLFATARDAASLAPLAEQYPENCRTASLDIAQPDQIRSVVAEAASAWGRLDAVVNNAGAGLLGALEECSDEEIRQNFETNCFGPLNVIRAALPVLRRQRSGHIVNISAAAAISNYPGFSVYGGAKAALELACESLRAETEPCGIKVTLVQPGPFRTNFIGALHRAAGRIPEYQATSGKFAALLEKMNGRQPGDPAKAAAAIFEMVHGEKAPLRFPLGKYVLKKMRDKAAALVRDAAEWETVAGNTDFSPAPRS